MKFRHRAAWLATAYAAAILFACATAASRPARDARPRARPVAPKALVIRVGVISYDAYAKGVQKYGDELRALSKSYFDRTGDKVVFQLAVGSYSDVLDWYNRELLDVAFLTPQPVAELRASLGDDELKRRYIATHATGGGPRPVFEYGAVCYVGKNTPIDTAAQLKEMAAQGHVSFLFVDPLSLSGRILPEYLLRSPEFGITNIKVNTTNQSGLNAAAYTYSRSASIAALAEQEEIDSLFTGDQPGQAGGQPPDEDFVAEKKWPVAFFYDGDIPEEYRGRLKQVSFPELESKKLPEEVALATPSFLARREKLLDLFRVDQPGSFFQTNPYPGRASWIEHFDDVGVWVRELKISSRDPHNQMFTLERIGKILRNYETQRGTPARLALVLSGGGAKCAYQLGAIRALESEVAIEPETGEERKVDIDLVVGTSGGAINALTVALGLTRDGPDEKYLRNNERLIATWKGFGPKDFFSPWTFANWLLTVATFLVEAVLLAWLFITVALISKLFRHDWGEWLYNYFGLAMMALGVLNLSGLVWLYRVVGFVLVGLGVVGGHTWQHLSLLLNFNPLPAAFILCCMGMGFHKLLWRSEDARPHFRGTHTFLRNALLVVVVVLVARSLFQEKTLSRSSIVESTLAEKMTRLVSPEAGAELASAEGPEMPQVLSALSQKYIAPGLARDLVITGSLLEGVRPAADSEHLHASLPPDIYFYHDQPKCAGSKAAAAGGGVCDPDPPADGQRRFRSFAGEDNHLLDVVIGSSSIYPIFPSRPLKGVGNIVDGGFAHNSPIEAAVMWKATHIILVEASPLSPASESYLLQNAQNALNHLYFQAQLSDLRARGKVEMFTLRPEETPGEPSMCTFDFDADAIGRAIRRGKEDAENNVEPRFERVPGEPVFEEVDFDNITEKNVVCPCSNAPPADDADVADVAGVD